MVTGTIYTKYRKAHFFIWKLQVNNRQQVFS